jgi:serine/threonine-protein kinase RsbW
VPTRRLELVIASDFEQVALLAHALRAACVGLGLTPTAAAEVELSAVEAVNNAIEHAYGDCPGEVRVTLTLSAEGVELEVRDRGRAMAPGTLEHASAPSFDPAALAELPEGGMGLGIVKDLMDEVHYRSDGGENRLTMSRRFNR